MPRLDEQAIIFQFRSVRSLSIDSIGRLANAINELSGGMATPQKGKRQAMEPNFKASATDISTACLIVIATAVAGFVIIYLQFVLVPFFLAILFYLLLEPLVDLLTQHNRRLCFCGA